MKEKCAFAAEEHRAVAAAAAKFCFNSGYNHMVNFSSQDKGFFFKVM